MGKIRVLTVLLAVLTWLTPLAGHAEDELFDTKAAGQHIEQGIAHLKAKNYDAAINEFEESAAISPEAEAYYYLGYAYYLKGRSGDGESRKLSRENFEKTYEIDPNFTPTRYKPDPLEPVEPQAASPAPAEKPAEPQPVQTAPSGTAQPDPAAGQPQQ